MSGALTKPLRWRARSQVIGDLFAETIIGTYGIGFMDFDGRWWVSLRRIKDDAENDVTVAKVRSREAGMVAAEKHYARTIRSPR